MQVIEPIDCELALAEDITHRWGHPAYPPPLPDDYANTLPCACVTSLGGNDATFVTFEHAVSIGVYADTWDEAMEQGRMVAGIVRAFEDGATENGRQWLECAINATPYADPDPNNYSVPRVSFAAFVAIRGKIIDI